MVQAGIGQRHRIGGVAQHPAQVDAMGEVVIAQSDGVEAQPVQRRYGGVKVMRPQPGAGQFVGQGGALDQVAIVEQQDIGAARAFLGDQRRQPGEAAGRGLGAETHVQIGGGQDAVQRGQLGCTALPAGQSGRRASGLFRPSATRGRCLFSQV